VTDITEVKRMLADRAPSVCEFLLPAGSRIKGDWCVGSISGEAGGSLKVCLSGGKAGKWSDFATGGEHRGDLLDLWCSVKGVNISSALSQACGWLGVDVPARIGERNSWVRPERPKCVRPQSDVLNYLTVERKISRESVTAYRVGEHGRTMVFHYFDPVGELINVKYIGIDRDEAGKHTPLRSETKAEDILMGWGVVPENAREICITEGEIDCLSMYDYGVVSMSVPRGGGNGEKQKWISSDFERMARFETIYLALDNDKEGHLGSEEIANRLGRHRCRRVLLPLKDANECLMAGIPRDVVMRCFAEAKSLDPVELKRASDFTEEVVRRFWPVDGVQLGYSLPYAKIREKLLFRPGELTIWTGASGSGKSQIISHGVAAWIDQGARTCLASFEMSAVEQLRRMVKQAGNVEQPTEEYIRHIMNEWMAERLWVFDIVGKSPIKRLLEVFEYARARYGCDNFIVDSLMRLGIGSEDYEGQERAVYELVNWTVKSMVHTHLVAHSRKADKKMSGVPETEDIKGASEIGSNAFNILSVWRNRELEDEIKAAEADARYDNEAQARFNELSLKPGVVLSIAKQRNGDHEGKCGLWFNQQTYQYRSSEDPRFGMQYTSLPST
jgi:twinkle protein